MTRRVFHRHETGTGLSASKPGTLAAAVHAPGRVMKDDPDSTIAYPACFPTIAPIVFKQQLGPPQAPPHA
jgi:hypothetical protein